MISEPTFVDRYQYVLQGLGLVEPGASGYEVAQLLAQEPARVIDAYRGGTFSDKMKGFRKDLAAYHGICPDSILTALRMTTPRNISSLNPVFQEMAVLFKGTAWNLFQGPLGQPKRKLPLSFTSMGDNDSVFPLPRTTSPGALTFHELLGRMREVDLASVYRMSIRMMPTINVCLKSTNLRSSVIHSYRELRSAYKVIEQAKSTDGDGVVAELFVEDGVRLDLPVRQGRIEESLVWHESQRTPRNVSDRFPIEELFAFSRDILENPDFSCKNGSVKFLFDPDLGIAYFLGITKGHL